MSSKDERTQRGVRWRWGVSLDDADGIQFLCPACRAHDIICWQPHVPDTWQSESGRWNFLGTGFDDLTLQMGSSSVHYRGPCDAHFWVRDGGIIPC